MEKETSNAQDRKILCVIIHFGNSGDTLRAASLAHQQGADICIVDNDPSNRISQNQVHTTPNYRLVVSNNVGFAEANNLGVETFREAHHRFLLILNNDVFLENDSISAMKDTLESKPNIGAVGPVLRYLDAPTSIWAAGGKISRIGVSIRGHSKVHSNVPYSVDYLPGAAILTRFDCWLRAGGLSTNYYLAFEEAEYAVRLRRMGFESVVCPKAKGFHRVGMSSNFEARYFYNKVRNRMIFGRFLFGRVGLLLATVSNLVRSLANPRRLAVFALGTIDWARNQPLNATKLNEVRAKFGDQAI